MLLISTFVASIVFIALGMDGAIRACQNGLSVRTAVKAFGVGRGTLSNRIKGRHEKKCGGQIILNEPEENWLVQLLKDCVMIGVSVSRKILRRIHIRIDGKKVILCSICFTHPAEFPHILLERGGFFCLVNFKIVI